MPKKKLLKPIPRFDNEEQEQEFWSTHDSTDYVDWSKAQRITFGRLKPSTQTISIRLEYVNVSLRAGCQLVRMGEWRDPEAWQGAVPRLLSLHFRLDATPSA